MKNWRITIVCFAIALAIPAAAGAEPQKKMSLSPMVGGYYYDREGETFTDYTLGLGYNFQASPDLGLEARLLYAPVGGSSTYYFITAGPRYTFLKADFFMAPSVEIHGGVLIPQGDKKDIDGVAGIGAMLLYKTRWDVEFGPEVSADAIFEGSVISFWASYMFVVKVNF